MGIKRLVHEDQGQDLSEYGLLMALIVLLAVATLHSIGQVVSNVFSNSATNIASS
jgi:Flp pilus assembly pilin Flp